MSSENHTHYEKELEKLELSYELALSADVAHLKSAIAGASELSVIGVGSGGSFTTASLLCNLHEAYTGRVSRPSTPLEIICNPTLAASSPVFLISAEGKNPDITEALVRARRHSARTIHVLTNRTSSPLAKSADEFSDVSTYVFNQAEKDGYLATNSLLLNAVLLARAYSELDKSKDRLPSKFAALRVGGTSISNWIQNAEEFAEQATSRGSVIVIYAPLLKPIAADLESKLAEAALLHCQISDLRSFAHGRHLWLSQRTNDCAILALTEPSLVGLWTAMTEEFPPSVPVLSMDLSGASPEDLIAGLIAQMHLLAVLARHLGKDPGRPIVPESGRNLYYIDLTKVIPSPTDSGNGVEQAKFDVLGARWPSDRKHGLMRRARNAYQKALEKQRFRAVVFDYDGTLCSSQRRDIEPSTPIVRHLENLLDAGVIVGIASGRGGSIQECLEQSVSKKYLGQIQLGLYNGGWVSDATSPPAQSDQSSEFLSHVSRIIVRLRALGVPIHEFKATHPYQISVRFREGLSTQDMWFVIADALRQAGLDLSRIVRSKHSVDILDNGVSKSRLIAHIIEKFKIDPYEILTIGDQGAWPGNDASLLEHKYSLSVDLPSRRVDRGWKFAPSSSRDVDATLWYLDRFVLLDDARFRLTLPTHNSEKERNHA